MPQKVSKVCAVDTLSTWILLITFFSSLLAFALIITGVVLYHEDDLRLAFGESLHAHYQGLIATGVLLILPGMCCGHYSAKRHNKFVMALYISMIFTFVLYHASFAIYLTVLVNETFSEQTNEPCVSFTPNTEIYNYSDTCSSFYESERSQGYYKLWVTRFTQGKDMDTDKTAWLASIQRSGQCCGFGKPGACRKVRVLPTDIVEGYVTPTFHYKYYAPNPMYDENNTFIGWSECGRKDEWYPATSGDNACEKTFQETQGGTYISGGCTYDLPIAGCDVLEGLNGCALYIDAYLSVRLNAYKVTMTVYIMVELFLMILFTCYCTKRKDAQILPVNMRKWTPEMIKDSDEILLK